MRVRRWIALCIIVLGVSATGCSRTTATQPGTQNAWTQAGVLRLGEPDEPDNLNPLFGHTAATDLADGMIFSFLLRYDANGDYIPDLATEVPSLRNGGISPNGRTITVHLRHHVRWSDGAPLTAADWIFTYHAVMNPANDTKSRYGWDDIASATAPDPWTLLIHLKHPDASFLEVLAMGGYAYPPLPAHLLAGDANINHARFNDHPISSGPYILRRWDHGSSLTFVPNPSYFRGAPNLKRVIWKVIPDVNTLYTALVTHEIDVFPDVDENHIAAVTRLPGLTIKRKLVANWRRLMFNTSRPALRHRRVRLAIAEAVDWPRLNATVYHGYGKLAVSDIFPRSWAAPAIAPYRYDPSGARRLLAAVGYRPGPAGVLQRDGRPLDLTIYSGNNKQENTEAEEVIQRALHAVGIRLRIRNYPVNLLFAQDGPLYTGHYDMEWTVDTMAPDPDNSGGWAGAFIPPNGADTAWLNDPLVNRLALAAKRTSRRSRRKALYQREEERLHTLVPAVPFTWERTVTAINRDVHHYDPAAYIADSWNSWQWEVAPSAGKR
ncbi:MAG: peptide ABC transporter substrate-binding protein [Vulcanimicrobiaceae bacterium]